MTADLRPGMSVHECASAVEYLDQEMMSCTTFP